jgi:tetratricopeptide (TPR) repeat protein
MADPLSRHRERFAADPDAGASFDLLEEHCFLGERWDELVALYRRRLGAPGLAGDAPHRSRLSHRLAQILEERLRDVEGALDAYRESVRLDPGRRAAWQGLRRLYGARESWAAVLQVAELEAAAIADPSERARLFEEMGDLWQDRLGDREQAEQFRARARSERDGAAPAPGRPAPEPRSEPAPGLDPEPAPDTDVDPSALVQSAWIAAARGDAPAAVASLRQWIDRHPQDVEAIDMLVTVLDGAERHGEMADLLERRASLAADPVTQAAVLTRLGGVREEQLGDLEGARSAYQRALARDPANPGAQLAFERMCRATESWSDLRGLLEQRVAAGPPAQRARALCQLGALLERQFGDIDAATARFEEALELDPGCAEATEALTRLRGGDTFPDLDAEGGEGGRENRAVRIVSLLERKLERIEADGDGADDAAVKLRLRLAELRGTTLDDPTGAIALLEPCLARESSLRAVAQRLALLYEALGRHQPLIELAMRAAVASSNAEERAEWHRRAAETARGIGNAELAVQFYQHLLEDRPNDRHAEAALLELYRSRGESRLLANLLLAELRRASRRDELALHLELAELFAGDLDDPAAAIAHWRRALALDPTRSEALDAALRCADGNGGAFQQLDLIDHVAAAATRDRDRARLLARRGDLLAQALGWIEEGAESWRRSLALDPEQPELRERLASVAAPA